MDTGGGGPEDGGRADRFGPLPGPGSPYYVPPPSTRHLRTTVVVLAVLPLVLLGVLVVTAVARRWEAVTAVAPLFALVVWLRWRRYRLLFAELRRRSHASG